MPLSVLIVYAPVVAVERFSLERVPEKQPIKRRDPDSRVSLCHQTRACRNSSGHLLRGSSHKAIYRLLSLLHLLLQNETHLL